MFVMESRNIAKFRKVGSNPRVAAGSRRIESAIEDAAAMQ